MLWGSVITSLIGYFLNSYYSSNLILYSTKEQLKDILPTFVASLVVAFVMWTLSLWDISVYVLLPIQVLTGILLGLFIYEKLHLDEYLEVKQLVLSAFKSK